MTTYGPAPRIAIFLNGKPSKTWFPKKKKKTYLNAECLELDFISIFPHVRTFFFILLLITIWFCNLKGFYGSRFEKKDTLFSFSLVSDFAIIVIINTVRRDNFISKIVNQRYANITSQVYSMFFKIF